MNSLVPLLLMICGGTAYHVLLKITHTDIHPVVSLAVTYGVACILSLALLLVTPIEHHAQSIFHHVNWVTFALGVSIVGIDIGYLLAYRAGSPVGSTSLCNTLLGAAILLPVSIVLFHEALSIKQLCGIAIGLVSLYLIKG